MVKANLETLFARFLNEMAEIGHCSPHTLRAYRKDLDQALGSLRERELPEEEFLLRKVKEAQIRWGALSLASRQRKAATMKSFLDWLYQNHRTSSPLNQRVEAPKVPRNIPCWHEPQR